MKTLASNNSFQPQFPDAAALLAGSISATFT
jgi:hypothetical protein